ncbi:type I restriction-modification system subunit M [Priestia aryabhattai]|uniref:type I restriction-modification system subunit M n=1 Tax=Priestia aryabhattai TaxID=412384 RepID=UPI002452975E|nr:class I SAM-dependent DNA methyltransferase [Priestia aryabhattai]MDH3111464.1 class I SAM-dependent DNA methyltransferase [Priestia aryabhattai]MDH3129615.1 class I SAM-dependent DNA methyltransferase [Priestia aryabhattai]
MITGELKNKIDRVWETFWTGGITNPLTVIEQFTYLLYIKGLDDNEKKKEADAELLGLEFEGVFPKDKPQLRWSIFSNMGPDEMFEVVTQEVFPFIKGLGGAESIYSKFMKDAIFVIPTPSLLARVVAGINGLLQANNSGGKKDTLGDLYEYLLSKLSTAGTNGQFRTPRHIIDMIVQLMKPTPEDIIVDPSAGSAGFLVAAGEYLKKEHNDMFLVQGLREHFNQRMFHGFEMDGTMLRIGAMNMMLHGVDNPNIAYRDSLSEKNKDTEQYTLVLANPPFKGSLDYESVSDDLLKVTKTKKTELLFLALFLRMLKKGGRCASIVPDGVLFGSSNAHKSIRKEIVENHKLEAIISMPSGVFKPYAGVSTAIMIFTKTGAGGTNNVWFYDMKADGYSLDDKRNPIESNDIPDILNRFNNLEEEKQRKRTDHSFFVPLTEIRKNEYDLSINKYKEFEYEEVSYESPNEILQRVEKLENEIVKGIKELNDIIGR